MVHLAVGVFSLGPAVAHGGLVARASTGGALLMAFIASAVLGLIMLGIYRVVPRRLSRLERTAALPEDMAALQRDLRDQLYAGMSGRSELVKRIFEKMLLPYMRAPLGWLTLIASGRSLREEQGRLRQRIEDVLEGRGGERLSGLESLLRAVVELRAVRAQRVLTATLRLGLPLHLLVAAIAAALLLAHLVEVLG
jgi:hypothetical protein